MAEPNMPELIAFPKREDLPEGEEVSLLHQRAVSVYQQLCGFLAELGERVVEIQRDCNHNFNPIREPDPHYRQGQTLGMDVFVGQRCKECKLFVPRREGHPWQVCHNCGKNMKYSERVPGQGGRFHVYTCESCGHEYSHS